MELRGNTALVTGTSGFVGGHVARRLAESEGMWVRALVRNPRAKTVVSLRHPSIQLVKGNLLDPTCLAAVSAGVKLVVHAAVSAPFTTRKIAWATTVDGTRNLYEAARTAGAQCFIFMSTFNVYFGAIDRYDDERTPLVPCGDLYGESKIAAEELLMAAAVGGPNVIILRAPAIYGPGSRRWTVQMIEDAKRGRLYLPCGGKFPFPYIYIDNLVDAIVAAALVDAPSGAYNVADGRVMYRDYVRPFARLAGRNPRHVPFWTVWLAAIGAEVLSRLTGRWIPLSRGSLRAMTARHRRRYATADKARHVLGWVPRIDMAEGMQHSEVWLSENGYVT
jgi:nucleoside-diphosphate-sugar epimerase